MSSKPTLSSSDDNDSNRTVVLICYILGGVGVVTALVPVLIALIICYIKRSESVNTIYYSHYDWLISTFWVGLFWAVLALLTSPFGIGVFIYAVLSIWLLYRFIKGLLRFSEKRAVA